MRHVAKLKPPYALGERQWKSGRRSVYSIDAGLESSEVTHELGVPTIPALKKRELLRMPKSFSLSCEQYTLTAVFGGFEDSYADIPTVVDTLGWCHRQPVQIACRR